MEYLNPILTVICGLALSDPDNHIEISITKAEEITDGKTRE